MGKSVVFNRLTGKYVTVSNYPGTTVDIAKGNGRVQGGEISVFDNVDDGTIADGMYRVEIVISWMENNETRSVPGTFMMCKVGV